MYGEENWKEALNLPDPAVAPAGEDNVTNDFDSVSSNDHGDEDPLKPRSVREYLINFIPAEDQDFERLAMVFLKKYVLGDGDVDPTDEDNDSDFKGVVATEAEAKIVVEGLANQVRRAILKILPLQIKHEPYRGKMTKADLCVWLQKPNDTRNFLCYKSVGLKALMAARSLTLANGPKTSARMVEALAGVPGVAIEAAPTANEEDVEDTSPRAAAIRAILKKSFLPFQKGKARDTCNLGHRLEKPILKKWVEVTHGEESLFGAPPDLDGIDVKGAYSAGLAAKKGAIYAKDSVDFVLVVKDPCNDEDSLVTWGFEAKGRVNARTAALEEREHLNFIQNPHMRVQDIDLFRKISNLGERFQLLQHAYVYDFPSVVFAISDDNGELIRSLVVDFSTELKDAFGTVLKDLKELTLEWAYPTIVGRPQVVNIPEEIFKISEDIPTINGHETLQGTANLWLALSKLPKPYPSFKSFIPGIYAYWNSVKGGSDTATKLMDDCVLRIPRMHLNPESVSITRLIMLLFVTFHRLFQVHTSDPQNNYPSLQHYRNAATHRTSFHFSILECYGAFKGALDKLQTPATPNNDPPDDDDPPFNILRPIDQNFQRQRRPRRPRHCNGLVPETTNFGAVLPMQTPRKMGYHLKRGTAATPVKQMVQKCSGIPLKTYPRKVCKCAECGNNTAWFCAGCKRWFCMERRDTDENGKSLKTYEHTIGGTVRTFQKACFHQAHEQRWRGNDIDLEGDQPRVQDEDEDTDEDTTDEDTDEDTNDELH